MKKEGVWRIIYLYIAINQKAVEIYTKLFEAEDIKELKIFWGLMVEERKTRALFWDKAKEQVNDRGLPSIFMETAEIQNDLTNQLEKIDALYLQWEEKKALKNALILAYRLEYYILDPDFELVFQALKPLAGGSDFSGAYDRHIMQFIDMFIRYSHITPELELLGETLQGLWLRNKVLVNLAMVDGLTGLMNRRGFMIIARELFYLAQRKKENIAIFMVDIDHFKIINDRYGHPKGDVVLKGVAQSLKSSIRKSDILCRYGGEEFIILFPHIFASAVPQMAEKIRKGVEDARPYGIPVTISIGVVQGIIRNASDKAFLSWISKADEHLYKAKANGRNCVNSAHRRQKAAY